MVAQSSIQFAGNDRTWHDRSELINCHYPSRFMGDGFGAEVIEFYQSMGMSE